MSRRYGKREKKIYKRLVALLIMMVMCFSVFGCTAGNSDTGDNNSTETTSIQDILSENDANETEEEAESGQSELSEQSEETEEEDDLTDTQRNSINMLNYMTTLAMQINLSSENQLFLESAYSSLVNDIYPNAVDSSTQTEILNLMDTIENYRMIAVKRERLEYIYERNRAQAMREAIPNPIGLLSAVQSGSMLKAAASVIYMAADSVSSYTSATSQAELQYIEDGWELDDETAQELHESTKDSLSYLFDTVRNYSLPGDYALNQESIQDFVEWSEKSNTISSISWLEANKNIYGHFSSYWLVLTQKYYENEDYEKCLDSIEHYESIATRIFRKDIDYATALPMVIISAKETMKDSDYIETAERYCEEIIANTKDSDWSLRYFTAQIYLDLFALTDNDIYLQNAYDIAFNNVNVLVDEQKEKNEAYLVDVETVTADEDATNREKKEIKAYNQLIKEQRKVELPPVSEALYLNCDLLFALAEELDISSSEQTRIESILHDNDEPIFLTEALDSQYWFRDDMEKINAYDIDISFDGGALKIPVTCVSDRSTISVMITGTKGETVIDDWTVSQVKRPQNAEYSEFIAIYKSDTADDYKYQDGDQITITVTPVTDNPEQSLEFLYDVVTNKVLHLVNRVSYERVIE